MSSRPIADTWLTRTPAFIDKFRYNAAKSSEAQSRIKKLERMPVLEAPEAEYSVHFKFGDVEKLSPPIIQMQNVSFGYSADGPAILRNVDLDVQLDSRIGIVGPNGAGKTTALKLLIGALEPTGGIIQRNARLRLAFFAQHHVDALDLAQSAVGFMAARFPGRQDEEYRRHLGAFGITGTTGLQRMALLSGGQKSRVAFAILSLQNPHILVLDEPSNHLVSAMSRSWSPITFLARMEIDKIVPFRTSKPWTPWPTRSRTSPAACSWSATTSRCCRACAAACGSATRAASSTLTAPSPTTRGGSRRRRTRRAWRTRRSEGRVSPAVAESSAAEESRECQSRCARNDVMCIDVAQGRHLANKISRAVVHVCGERNTPCIASRGEVHTSPGESKRRHSAHPSHSASVRVLEIPSF